MKIFLVGFMGAGKTTVGRELARRIDMPFFDLDELIETSESSSVKEIFAAKGERYFRGRERDLLRSTKPLSRAVIATGGGTFTFDENIHFIRSEGVSVYLSAPLHLLTSRVGSKADDRPLFGDEVATRDLYQYRLRYYKMSDLTIDVRESETVSEVVERLVMLLPKELLAGVKRGASS